MHRPLGDGICGRPAALQPAAGANLRRQIERFVDHWNEYPNPFIWTATSGSILAKTERLGKDICGTSH